MGCGASTEGDAVTQNARHSEDLTYWPQQEMGCVASGWCGGKQQRGLKVYKYINISIYICVCMYIYIYILNYINILHIYLIYTNILHIYLIYIYILCIFSWLYYCMIQLQNSGMVVVVARLRWHMFSIFLNQFLGGRKWSTEVGRWWWIGETSIDF
jgi:hypothetical protein